MTTTSNDLPELARQSLQEEANVHARNFFRERLASAGWSLIGLSAPITHSEHRLSISSNGLSRYQPTSYQLETFSFDAFPSNYDESTGTIKPVSYTRERDGITYTVKPAVKLKARVERVPMDSTGATCATQIIMNKVEQSLYLVIDDKVKSDLSNVKHELMTEYKEGFKSGSAGEWNRAIDKYQWSDASRIMTATCAALSSLDGEMRG
jgi:hypothetical protein